VSQPCSAKCADEFLPFHDQCRGRPPYVALMPLGGGSVRANPSVQRWRRSVPTLAVVPFFAAHRSHCSHCRTLPAG
jgi:hypothetical protein